MKHYRPHLDEMQIKIAVSPRKIIRLLLIGAIFFAVVSAIIQVSEYVFGYEDDWTSLFNVDRELNFPTWYSALMIIACSALLKIIATGKQQQEDRYTKDWLLLSRIFCFMAIDEIVSLHEIFIIPEVSEALNLPWFLHSAWVIPGMIFLLWFIRRYRKFVRHLPPQAQKNFILAGCIYVGGALVMEMIGSHFAESLSQQHIIYTLTTTLEEFLEMLGIILFIHSLFQYLNRWAYPLNLQVGLISDEHTYGEKKKIS